MTTNTPKWDAFRNYRPAKCKAKDPRTCPFHGRAAKQKEAFYREILAAEKKKKDAELNAQFVEDLDASLKPKTLKDGTRTVTVYRAGDFNPPAERGVESPSYLFVDGFAPEGRQGRNTGVFAAPSLGGVARWVDGISSVYQRVDVRVRAVNVNPDTTYIYSVQAWEKASSGFDFGGDRAASNAKAYWDSGMTLMEWESRVRAGENLDPTQWEMLLPASAATDSLNPKGLKIVAPKTVADRAYRDSKDGNIYKVLTSWARYFRENAK